MDKFNDKYDLILVGCGIANIMCALECLNRNPNMSILMLEKGNQITSRSCPKAKTGKCVDCKPSCQITTGFAGAGCFSDSKLTFSPDVGGNLINYIGQDKFDELLSNVESVFTEYGGDTTVHYNEEYANALQYECSKYGMKLVKSKIRHLGTDGSYNVMLNIYNKLISYPNVAVLCNTEVVDMDLNEKVVYTTKGTYTGKHISVAVGRYGSEWLRKLCVQNNIKLINGDVDVGVRVEVPNAVTDDVTRNLYEFKIINYSDSDNKVRSFCVNPGGFVTQENYDNGIACVNGHSYLDTKSQNTNFALLVSSHFTDPFNEPIKYGQRVCEIVNMLADGKPMVQRLIDLKNKKRTTRDRLSRLSITPTLKDAEPGDLRYALPPNILDSIVQTLDNMANVIPNINGKNTILYAPEVKFYSSKIELNNNLQCDKFKDVYFLGDSSGVTHGIIQSAMSGVYAAQQIVNKL